jgi:hypothetical protein
LCFLDRPRAKEKKKERQSFLILLDFFSCSFLFIEGCLQEDEHNNELRKIRRRKRRIKTTTTTTK